MFKNPLVLAFIASLFFGVWPVPLKTAIGAGPGSDVMVWVGIAMTLAGCIWKLLEGGSFSWSPGLIGYSLIAGGIFSLGLACTIVAIGSKEGYIALVAPIYNINTLWAMLFGMWIFKEYQHISVPYAVFGAILITLGGGLTGLAKHN